MHSLSLLATPGKWRLFAARKADIHFKDYAERIWQRDSYVCQFCGFQAKDFQEILNLDGNYRNNKMANLVTACCFCTQCVFLEMAGKSDYGGGALIYFPELSQPELNGLCHVLFCAIANATSYRPDAQNIYRNLKTRSQMVEEQLGEGMSDPAVLGQVLIEAQLGNREPINDSILNNLRLLPSRTKFSMQIETWAKAAVDEMTSQ